MQTLKEKPRQSLFDPLIATPIKPSYLQPIAPILEDLNIKKPFEEFSDWKSNISASTRKEKVMRISGERERITEATEKQKLDQLLEEIRTAIDREIEGNGNLVGERSCLIELINNLLQTKSESIKTKEYFRNIFLFLAYLEDMKKLEWELS